MSLLCFAGVLLTSSGETYAAAVTVTIKYGKIENCGDHNTIWKYVTHVNGEPIDLDDEPGVTRSYAYCVEPMKDGPGEGTYTVVVVDDDDTGKIAKMRKLIYYLPGAYGYTAVTKSRWFSTKSTYSDYALGHLALSYMYDNCKSSTEALYGVTTAGKNKVKSMVEDLDNLAEPPEDFEVFWVKEAGLQSYFGAIYATEYGQAEVKKLSAIDTITDNNACYTLEGAEYTIYKDEQCTEAASTKAGNTAIIKIKADGSSDPVTIETGSYYIKETAAPRGYALDNVVHSITVEKDKTSIYTAYDTPKSNPVQLLIQKVDKETGLAKPQGAASLASAEYTIKYYDVYPDKSMTEQELLNAIKGADVADIDGIKTEWTYRTDAEGKIDFSNPDKYMLKSEGTSDRTAFYTDSSGRCVFPIGIITIQETAAPKGYVLDTTVYARAITEEGTTETLNTLQTMTGKAAHREQVYRGDISFSKSSGGLWRMHQVPFKLTSVTTGESHIIITDNNGYANTSSSWNLHTSATNAGKTDEDGIWFNGYNSENGAVANDSLCALPYDTYIIEELRCEANKGYKLFKDTITIKRNNVLIDLGTYDNRKEEFPPPSEVPEEPTEKTPEDTPDTPDTPDTGDRQNDLVLYGMAGLLAVAELGILTIKRKGDRLKSGR